MGASKIVEEPESDVLNFVRRKMIWDLMPHDETDEVFAALNMVPASQDVAEVEHLESHYRLKGLVPLQPAIDLYSSICTEIVGAALMGQAKDDEIPAELKQRFNQQTFDLIRPAAYAVVGQLLETGLLHMGHNSMVMS